jgi:segregation and condensation protein B
LSSDSNLPPGFSMPNPDDAPDLREDEDPLEDENEPLGAGEDDGFDDDDEAREEE